MLLTKDVHQPLLTDRIKLLRIQVHSTVTLASVIHQPHGEAQRPEDKPFRNPLRSISVELPIERRELRQTSRRKPIRDALPSCASGLWRSRNQVFQLPVLPFHVRPLINRVVDLKEGMRLATHGTIPEQTTHDQ